MDRVGIERLCVFGMPPVPFVQLAASLDCRHIGIGLTPMRYNPDRHAHWSLRDDSSLRQDLRAALALHGVEISLCEGFGVRHDADIRDQAGDLDIAQQLGARRINVVSIDRDRGRTFEQFAILAAMAHERGIETMIEIGPGPIPNLAAALEALAFVAQPHFRLLIDTMHFVRFGSTAEELAAIDPAAIGYLQLCDAPLVSRHDSYMDEALHERMLPGTGELPLEQLLAAVPEETVIGIEVPQRSLLEAGMDDRERVRRCVDATRALLARVRPRIV
jgi:sugar phosphate isomerase/epimerase